MKTRTPRQEVAPGKLSSESEATPAPVTKSHAKHASVDDPELFLNRELAWLTFNERVLGEAECKFNPLMERLKFLTIFHSNLDEFFMVRLARLLKMLENEESGIIGPETADSEDLDPEEMLDEVALKVRTILKRASVCFHGNILPALEEKGILIAPMEDLSRTELERVDEYFEQQVFPVLTPLAIDPAHPFPYLTNLSLYLAVRFEEMGNLGAPFLAFVEIPPKLNRFISVSTRGRKHKFVLLEDIIRRHLDKLFNWPEVVGAHLFRVTRNLDYELFEGEVKDLMKSIELELKDRAQKIVVRLEVETGTPEHLRNRMRLALGLDASDVYEVVGILNMRDATSLLKLDVDASLKDAPFASVMSSRLSGDRDIFEVIRERNIFLHHPFDGFGSVLEFLRQAADDPNVLAIKQTLYRTGGDFPVTESLVRAAENGKQVTAVVELKARFDEQNNIAWAKRLEHAGVHVVFGFVGLKTHGKCTLVVRRENSKLQRYIHLSTGNYNSSTAKLYTDIGILTCDAKLTEDVMNLFNLLTGFNIIGGEERTGRQIRPPHFEKLKVAPFGLRNHFLHLIDNEKRNHSAENPGHIILKMNALVDQKLVQALYKASQKGVKIELIIRGVCVLKPGVPGVSENIKVVSVIDRFLEHSRIYWFRHSGQPVVYLGSADFMPRNMDRRIEAVWPVDDDENKARIWELLQIYLRDNIKSHVMQSDGTYKQNSPLGREKPFRAQEKLIEIARRVEGKPGAFQLDILALKPSQDEK